MRVSRRPGESAAPLRASIRLTARFSKHLTAGALLLDVSLFVKSNTQQCRRAFVTNSHAYATSFKCYTATKYFRLSRRSGFGVFSAPMEAESIDTHVYVLRRSGSVTGPMLAY